MDMSPFRGRCAIVAGSCLLACDAAIAQQLEVPTSAPIDRLVSIRAAGLLPGSTVALRTIAIDDAGQRWTARAIYRADAAGAVDVQRDVPVSTSYGDFGPGGLFSGMQADGDDDHVLRFQSREARNIVTSVVLEDSTGARLDSVTVDRHVLAPGVREIPVTDQGLRGHLFVPNQTPA